MAPNMKTVDLIYVNAGGGHRSAAIALDTAIREQGLPWRVRLINLFEVLDPRDTFGKTTGMKPEQYYNARLERGWTLGLAQELRVFQALIRLGHRTLTAQLTQHWEKTKPDLVVSLVPNFNRAMYEALAGARPNVPYVTILTDFADSPPHFWIEPGQAQHLICGTRKAVLQARAAGYDDSRIHQTSGMILRPDFYRPLNIDRRAELEKLQFDPDRPTGIVMFGGHGSKVMRRIAKHLEDTQLILICGHNSELADRLRATRAKAPRAVVGFSSQIPYFMRPGGFFHRQARSREHQRSHPSGIARHRGAKRVDHAAGALQRGLDSRARRRPGLGFLLGHPRRRVGSHEPPGQIPGKHRAHQQPRHIRNTRHPRSDSVHQRCRTGYASISSSISGPPSACI